ncbi:MAG: 4Fe-4S binding protein [Brockia lithotrophica]|nr:4Fe-4S binding protein [Brockia lithotrophica]
MRRGGGTLPGVEYGDVRRFQNGRREGAEIVGKARPRFAVYVDVERCKGCGLCVNACPHDSLVLSEGYNAKGYHPAEFVNPEACKGCAFCAYMCPDVVLAIVREEVPLRA